MTFLHSKTSFEVYSLVYVWNKSSYAKILTSTGKMKPIWLNDKTFNLSWIKDSPYKLTFEWTIDLEWSEEIIVKNWIYIWKYKLKDFKKYEWIKLITQKLLLTKV